MKATLEESLGKVKELEEECLSRLPEGLTEVDREDFEGRIQKLFLQITLHVKVIYRKRNWALGENLSFLLEYEDRKNYRWHSQRIKVHMDNADKQVEWAKEAAESSGDERALAIYNAQLVKYPLYGVREPGE